MLEGMDEGVAGGIDELRNEPVRQLLRDFDGAGVSPAASAASGGVPGAIPSATWSR